MAVEIKIPEIGESITSGVIAAWTKGEGEWVEQDETVLELETDKITMEIPAPAAGVLKTNAAEGDEVEVGSSVGSIDESAEKPAGGASAGANAGAQAANAESGGGTATAAPPATDSAAKPEPNSQPKPQTGGSAAGASPSDQTDPSPAGATPLARKLAQDLGVDLGRIKGTGAGHKVREQDVLAFWQGGSGAAMSN
ncbi:MAG: biotin/lipoyl-containing protein, partial [Planctomycetota bacterium]